MDRPSTKAAAPAAYKRGCRKVDGRTIAMKTNSAGAARKAMRWLPTDSAKMNAIRTSRLPCLPLSSVSCHRNASQDNSAIVKSETV